MADRAKLRDILGLPVFADSGSGAEPSVYGVITASQRMNEMLNADAEKFSGAAKREAIIDPSKPKLKRKMATCLFCNGYEQCISMNTGEEHSCDHVFCVDCFEKSQKQYLSGDNIYSNGWRQCPFCKIDKGPANPEITNAIADWDDLENRLQDDPDPKSLADVSEDDALDTRGIDSELLGRVGFLAGSETDPMFGLGLDADWCRAQSKSGAAVPVEHSNAGPSTAMDAGPHSLQKLGDVRDKVRAGARVRVWHPTLGRWEWALFMAFHADEDAGVSDGAKLVEEQFIEQNFRGCSEMR